MKGKPKNHRLSAAVRRDIERASAHGELTKVAVARRIAAKHHLSVTHVQNVLSGNSLRVNRAGLQHLLQAITDEMVELFRDAGLDEKPTDYVEEFLDEQPSLFEETSLTKSRRVIDVVTAPRLTVTNYQTASLDEWQGAFWDVYGEQDAALKLHDMMLQLTVDATRLTEAIRKEEYVEALESLPRVMSWVFSLSSKTASRFSDLSPNGALLSEVIWKKYPGLCSLCAEKRCICVTWVTDDLTREERAEMERANRTKLDHARATGLRPSSLNEWIAMFERVYGRVNRSRSASDKMLHLWEEIGELEVELRNADRIAAGETQVKEIEWESELADVFSWISSVYLHINGYHRRAGEFVHALERKAAWDAVYANAFPRERSFANWLWLEFGGDPYHGGLRCHKCRQTSCGCGLDYPRR